MKPQVMMLLLPLVLGACGSNAEKKTAANTTDTTIVSTGSYAANRAAAPLPALPACYQLTTGKDTALLRLRNKSEDGEISGDLDIRSRGGKNNSSGSFFGTMTGDTLIANYSYLQKGKRKVREVAFLRRGDAWLEGRGPAADRSGIRRFADRSQLDFSDETYQKVTCE